MNPFLSHPVPRLSVMCISAGILRSGFKTVLRGDVAHIRIGERSNIQDLCMGHVAKDTPLIIGNNVTIGHSCCVHGTTIGDGCLIGMGAVLLNNSVIGQGCVIAAGAVVLERAVIPPYSLVTGSPGKVKKVYDNREQIDQMMKKASDNYVRHARDFASNDLVFEIKN